MCGIGGIVRVWPGGDVPRPLDAIPEGWLDILDESIKHRGPDGRGRFRQRVVRADGAVIDVALVHRRLSIIDHAGGAQPMVIGVPLFRARSGSEGSSTSPAASFNAADPTPALLALESAPYAPIASPHVCPRCQPGITAVVFNGCIYNHRDLRRELEAAGHEFHTDHSDTEVLLHGWREWGPGLIDRLDGMYALALWDERAATITFFRDPFGEKPLYDTATGSIMAWCSTAAGLAKFRAAIREPVVIDPDLAATGWIERGCCSTIACARVHEHPSWTIESFHAREAGRLASGPGLSKGGPTERHSRTRLTSDRVRDLLRSSLQARLSADVPVGCFLSGGVDSSLLAALAKDLAPGLATFTVRMPDPRYDESAAAAHVADILGTRHETLDVAAAPAADLVALTEQLGLPFGDSSLLPTYWLSHATRSHAKVAISGDGGDELFCGYERHVALRRLQRWRWVAALVPSSLLPRRDPKSIWSKLARLGVAARGAPNRELAAIFPGPDHYALTGVNAVSGPVADPGHWDAQFYLGPDLLRKTDTASMAVALEVRAPFLQRDLALAALSEPISSLMPHGQRKGLLRAVARKYLPADIVDRPKQGFAIPISDWFRTDFGGMRQLLLDHLRATDPFPGLADAGIDLNMDFVRQMLTEHDDAGAKSLWPWKGRDHGQRLYMLLVLSIWCRWLERVRRGG